MLPTPPSHPGEEARIAASLPTRTAAWLPARSAASLPVRTAASLPPHTAALLPRRPAASLAPSSAASLPLRSIALPVASLPPTWESPTSVSSRPTTCSLSPSYLPAAVSCVSCTTSGMGHIGCRDVYRGAAISSCVNRSPRRGNPLSYSARGGGYSVLGDAPAADECTAALVSQPSAPEVMRTER